MEKKGQGALEYLLLIGGAVLVAVIVITLLLGLTESSGNQTDDTAVGGLCRTEAQKINALDPTINDCNAVKVDYKGVADITCTGTFPECNCINLNLTAGTC